MLNFEYWCPTRVIFGKNTILRLADLIGKDKKVMMIYGGGSIKKNCVYQQVKSSLSDYNVIEFSGIEPNPAFETCMEAVALAKRENVDFLLAVGGGSVLDATKFIAAAVKYNGDPWEILTTPSDTAPPCINPIIKDALPLGSVITLPATGSEMNAAAVISRKETGEKLFFGSHLVYPTFSIIDPETTYSLPEKQTINGIIDTFVHVCEQYVTYDTNTPLQDSWALGLLKTLIQEAPKVLKNPNDYDARANIFWCATCGLNHWISPGVVQDWSTHMIGHELTAFYGLDHGQTLAIVMPRVWENQIEGKKAKLAKMAREIYGCDGDDMQCAKTAIKKTEEFFNSIGQKTKLAEYGVDANEAAEKIYERLLKRGAVFGETQKLTPDVVREIIRTC